jgi:hypothetical protein
MNRKPCDIRVGDKIYHLTNNSEIKSYFINKIRVNNGSVTFFYSDDFNDNPGDVSFGFDEKITTNYYGVFAFSRLSIKLYRRTLKLKFKQVKDKIDLLVPFRESQYKVTKLDFDNIIKINIMDYKYSINFSTLELLKKEFLSDELKIENDGFNGYVITFDVQNYKYFH